MRFGRMLVPMILAMGCLGTARLQAEVKKIQVKIDNKTNAGKDGNPYFLLFPDYGVPGGDPNALVEIKDGEDASLKADALLGAKPVALLPGHVYVITYQLKKAAKTASDIGFYLADLKAKGKDNKRIVELGERFNLALPSGNVEHLQTTLSNQRNVAATLKKALNPDTPAKDSSVSSIVVLRKAYDKVVKDKAWAELLAQYPQKGGPLVVAILKNATYRKDFLDWALPLSRETHASENFEFLNEACGPKPLTMREELAIFDKYIAKSAPMEINLPSPIHTKLTQTHAAMQDLDYGEAILCIANLITVNEIGKQKKRFNDYLETGTSDYYN